MAFRPVRQRRSPSRFFASARTPSAVAPVEPGALIDDVEFLSNPTDGQTLIMWVFVEDIDEGQLLAYFAGLKFKGTAPTAIGSIHSPSVELRYGVEGGSGDDWEVSIASPWVRQDQNGVVL